MIFNALIIVALVPLTLRGVKCRPMDAGSMLRHSGLDPHVSPAYAALQIPRIAKQRGLAEDEVKRLIDQGTEGRSLGILGQPREIVLRVNMALEARAPGESGGKS